MSTPIRMTMSATDWVLLILLSIIWGGSYFFIEIALTGFPPLVLVSARVGMAALVLWGVVALTGNQVPTQFDTWRRLITLGAINSFIPFSLISWGQLHVGGGLAAVLLATTPMAGQVIAHFFTDDEKIRLNALIGTAIGLVGVAVMLGADLISFTGLTLLAQLAMLCASVSYASASVYARRFSDLSPFVVSAGQMSGAFMLSLPVAIAFGRPWEMAAPSITAVLALLALAVVSTALAFIIFLNLIRRAGANNALLVTFLIPVTALILTTTILGERFTTSQIAGMALILFGLLVLDGRVFRRAHNGAKRRRVN